MRFSAAAIAAILAGFAMAHPGHDVKQEIAERASFMSQLKTRDLSHCSAKLKARGLEQAAVARRSAIAKSERKKRGISSGAPYLRARDEATVLNTTHLSSVNYNASTDESIIFSGNNSCILSPEVTQGPYYVSGEYVRKDIVEDQEGVDLILDTQVIDMATCDPVTNAFVEIWHCNSTGVYSGIVASTNGNSADATNINSTFLRGLQATDDEGVAQFQTLFPGHYTSRSNHIHVLVHFNGTIYANGTYGGGVISHVGQMFFDQDLITQVEAISPYTTNRQPVTLNSEDSVLSDEAASSDPLIEYSLLGETVADGIFGWLAFGVNISESYRVQPAASLYASGGVEN
ncbi:hypothetical protein MFRU_024g00840 [Monilinia fructicola]|uniref:Intradiol ring-cleavage dioxygenases domain-containing protein n=1 Tax=Monilinia fructicola TaxID=38448 RepID=A0A5M9J551_MONFR|nr:hypothetical protein EYC84_011746 [Monilinia fructicola]KAG4028114.1 hypothetical protein MFRU_024g00840 [Monilinia fructicola]